MKRVIDRQLYDTKSAEQIARYAPITDRGDFHHQIETLYKSDGGEFFLHAEGGPATEYAERCNGGKTSGEVIKLMDEDAALDWCEERSIDGEIIVAEFSHLIEI
ncbi:hypothetical protein OB955_03760 [Halobacteria archaeon AArc-m2/3/4]|uniref:Uncharacterized protein n=1 Tax=Natronoglomus mannanivorans TaxID=2979990 RepID=A0ABT2QA90_9EURY|nr:hypothetical protein [Halobacteria archaeon AArc-m2/3/4]